MANPFGLTSISNWIWNVLYKPHLAKRSLLTPFSYEYTRIPFSHVIHGMQKQHSFAKAPRCNAPIKIAHNYWHSPLLNYPNGWRPYRAKLSIVIRLNVQLIIEHADELAAFRCNRYKLWIFGSAWNVNNSDEFPLWACLLYQFSGSIEKCAANRKLRNDRTISRHRRWNWNSHRRFATYSLRRWTERIGNTLTWFFLGCKPTKYGERVSQSCIQ